MYFCLGGELEAGLWVMMSLQEEDHTLLLPRYTSWLLLCLVPQLMIGDEMDLGLKEKMISEFKADLKIGLLP